MPIAYYLPSVTFEEYCRGSERSRCILRYALDEWIEQLNARGGGPPGKEN